jgi:hypothetical protein
MLIKLTPIIAVEEFEKIVKFIKESTPSTDIAALVAVENALITAQTKGLPHPSTYSLNHIEATDNEDLNMKIGLITAMVVKYYQSGVNIDMQRVDEIQHQLEELIITISYKLIEGENYPLSITID